MIFENETKVGCNIEFDCGGKLSTEWRVGFTDTLQIYRGESKDGKSSLYWELPFTLGVLLLSAASNEAGNSLIFAFLFRVGKLTRSSKI